MKKSSLVLAIVVLFLSLQSLLVLADNVTGRDNSEPHRFTAPASATSSATRGRNEPSLKRRAEENKNDLRDLKKKIVGEREAIKKEATGDAKRKDMTLKERITNGIIKSIDTPSSSFVMSRENSSDVTVKVLSTTKLLRHFFGTATLTEFSTGDKVAVYGKYTDDTKTTLNADVVKNNSIMKRFGAFVGQVSNLNGNTFDLITPARGTIKVTVNSTTKFVNRKEQPMTLSDIKNDDRIRVKGMWDVVNKTVTEVSHLKDYSIPTAILKPTKEPETTKIPTTAPSVTPTP